MQIGNRRASSSRAEQGSGRAAGSAEQVHSRRDDGTVTGSPSAISFRMPSSSASRVRGVCRLRPLLPVPLTWSG